jgi:anti-anti-sigma factor
MAVGKIQYAQFEGLYLLKFIGEIRLSLCAPLEGLSAEQIKDLHIKNVLVDLSEATLLDSTALGLLAKIALTVRAESGEVAGIICPDHDLKKLMLSMSLDKVFCFVEEPDAMQHPLIGFEMREETADQLRKRALAAHKVLSELSDSNRMTFQDVINALQSDD